MACAVMTTVPKGSVYTTLEYKINIVRAIRGHHPVHCGQALSYRHAGRPHRGKIDRPDAKALENGKALMQQGQRLA